MRIRSIKPEFWESPDIDSLDLADRLLFIGLWSYVDDNGVGKDVLARITADLFAGDLERDAPETFARVSRGLQNLFEAGRIVRYTAEDKPYLYVVNWNKHQRIDKPGKPRYPAPTRENAEIRETLARVSRDTPESIAPGAGEQGNRGTGEQGSKNMPSLRSAADAIVAEFEDFWKLYPRKVSKKPALKAYQAARKKVDITVIASALHVHIRAMANRPVSRIPYAATWLNTEPWHDDPEAIAPVELVRSNRQQETDDIFDAAAERMGVTTHTPRGLTA